MNTGIPTHTAEQFKAVVSKFKPSEFAEDPIKYADPHALVCLMDLRLTINSSISPSLASGALARFDGSKTSRHYVDLTLKEPKYSTAFDLFFKADPRFVFYTLLCESAFRGIGVYFDTRNNKGVDQIMFHVDIRKDRATWCRIDGKYYYVRPNNSTLKKIYTLLG